MRSIPALRLAGALTVATALRVAADSSSLTTHHSDAVNKDMTIRATFLKQMLDYYLPPETKKLLVFAQCFGGGFAVAGPWNADPNTAVAAATAPNTPAYYDGYHDEAAAAFGPGAGKTGQTVHDAGVAGRLPDRDSVEASNVGGGLPLSQFSLEPTTANGAVRSRHVIVYAGRPETKSAFDTETNTPLTDPNTGERIRIGDTQDRDRIEANFAGQLNTSVTTVGGKPDPNDPTKGQDGWDYPADLRGLEQAIKDARDAIAATGNPPASEQFLLFVSDHGERLGEGSDGWTMAGPVTAPQNASTTLGSNFVVLGAEERAAIRYDPNTAPGFLLFMPFDGQAVPLVRDPTGVPISIYPPGSARLEITLPAGEPIRLDDAVERVAEYGDGLIGTQPGEGLAFFFPVDRDVFFDRLVDLPLTLSVHNAGPAPMVFSDVFQTTGPTVKGPYRCETTADCLLHLDWSLPDVEDAPDRRTRRLWIKLDRLDGKIERGVQGLEGTEGRKRERRERRVANLIDGLTRVARRADRVQRLGVPLYRIEIVALSLKDAFNRPGEAPSTSTTTTSTTSTSTTTSTIAGPFGRALVGSGYEGVNDICLSRIDGGCTYPAHEPNCAVVHLHQPITIDAGPPGPLPDPNTMGCGHGEVAIVFGCGPDDVPPCP